MHFTMGRNLKVVFVSVILLLGVWETAGLQQCVDREPAGCDEYINSENCDNPGISEQCMKTCNACRTNGDVPECTPGYVDMGTSCHPCADFPLEDIFNNKPAQCPQGCDQGYWGRRCDKHCDSCSQGSCEAWSGRCLTNCPNGRYGRHCFLLCENCLHGSCCENGHCQHGCQRGWYGPRCLQRHD